MTASSRARRRFLADQAEAAGGSVEELVTAAAARTGQQVTQLDDREPMSADPLASWFIRAYVRATRGTHVECEHLDNAAPQPRRWDSAAPAMLLCEARCTGPGLDLQLRAKGLLPARCGRCGVASATHHMRIAIADTMLICRVCEPCLTKHSPPSDGAA